MTLDLAIGERVLGNGLTLLVVHNEGVATFAAAAVLDVDLRDEGKGEHGLANLLGDCLDEGTAQRTGIELAEAVDELGANLAGSASGGSITGPAATVAPALHLLREMLAEPRFDPRDVDRVKDEVIQEIQVDAADPGTVARLRFKREVYGAHPLGRPPYGTAADVARFQVADLRRFHGRWFVPERGYVALAGPAEVEAGLDLLESVFGAWAGGGQEHVRPAPPAMPRPGIDVHLPMAREQVHVFLGHPGIRRTNPDYYALCVMDHVLGTGPGFTSRIARRLRDEEGLCYSVYAGITASAAEEPGTFAAYIGTSPEHREKAIDGFLEEIDRIRDGLVGDDELEDVVEYLTGSYVFGFERNAQLARYVVRAKRFALGFEHLREYPGLIRAVTAEDVQRVARQYLQPAHMVRVSAGAGSLPVAAT